MIIMVVQHSQYIHWCVPRFSYDHTDDDDDDDGAVVDTDEDDDADGVSIVLLLVKCNRSLVLLATRWPSIHAFNNDDNVMIMVVMIMIIPFLIDHLIPQQPFACY